MYGDGARNGLEPELLPDGGDGIELCGDGELLIYGDGVRGDGFSSAGDGAVSGFSGILLNVRRDEVSGTGETCRLTGVELLSGFFGIAEGAEPASGETATGPTTSPLAL